MKSMTMFTSQLCLKFDSLLAFTFVWGKLIIMEHIYHYLVFGKAIERPPSSDHLVAALGHILVQLRLQFSLVPRLPFNTGVWERDYLPDELHVSDIPTVYN